MCQSGFLFCIFYYLGFLSIAGAFGAGIFIIWNNIKHKNDKEEL